MARYKFPQPRQAIQNSLCVHFKISNLEGMKHWHFHLLFLRQIQRYNCHLKSASEHAFIFTHQPSRSFFNFKHLSFSLSPLSYPINGPITFTRVYRQILFTVYLPSNSRGHCSKLVTNYEWRCKLARGKRNKRQSWGHMSQLARTRIPKWISMQNDIAENV